MVASGYAAVWARENPREALFDAMKRKETYATTGPRMLVRFFGGWDFVSEDANTRLPGEVGYTKGVPMGGDLATAPKGTAPTFMVYALRDPIGANLDRIQIIKGWDGEDGSVHQRVFDVAGTPDNGASVDPGRASRAETDTRACARCGPTRVRPEPARRLLQPRRRESELPLERLGLPGTRRRLLGSGQRPARALRVLRSGSTEDDPGARLDLAHLVHAPRHTVTRRAQRTP